MQGLRYDAAPDKEHEQQPPDTAAPEGAASSYTDEASTISGLRGRRLCLRASEMRGRDFVVSDLEVRWVLHTGPAPSPASHVRCAFTDVARTPVNLGMTSRAAILPSRAQAHIILLVLLPSALRTRSA